MYKLFKDKQAEEVGKFVNKYCIFAFSNEQLTQALEKHGLTYAEFHKDYCKFMGGAIRVDQVSNWHKLNAKQTEELHNKMETDYNFAKEAFMYELNNYEVIYGKLEEALGALGYSSKEVNEHEALNKAFKDAYNEYMNWAVENC